MGNSVMPTRLIREGIIASDRVNQLDWAAEVFYRRLLNKVDDFGLYDGRPSILRANLYPLRVDRVREADISRWVAMCDTAGLIVPYEADGKPYLKVLDTRWKTRSDPKYPLPNENSCKQPQTAGNNRTVVVDVDVDVVEALSDSAAPNPDALPLKTINGQKAACIEVLDFLNATAGKRFRASNLNLDLIRCRLKDGISVDQLRKIIVRKCREWLPDDKMRNYLRPATLFNKTKCEQYVGELVPASEEKHEL